MHKENSQVAVFKTISSPFDYQNQKRLLLERQALKHPNLMNIIDFAILESNETETKTSLIYEGWNMDLEEDVYSRQQQQPEPVFFEEKELFHVMYGAIQGLNNLHQANLVHGDIKPNNIAYIDSTTHMDIKLVD